jgi:hypothetical protein
VNAGCRDELIKKATGCEGLQCSVSQSWSNLPIPRMFAYTNVFATASRLPVSKQLVYRAAQVKAMNREVNASVLFKETDRDVR